MSKVKFGESDSHIVELQQTASLERQQADNAIRKSTRMRRRIRAFYDAIEYVSFRSAEEAPIWASNWLDWLLDGIVPELVDAETVTVEAVPEDQPTLEPDPETPTPPTAAVA